MMKGSSLDFTFNQESLIGPLTLPSPSRGEGKSREGFFSPSPSRGEGLGEGDSSKGQAVTELVLLVPLFLIFAIGIVKIFALGVMVQKLELASYYAGRRWMLESHKNVSYAQHDTNLAKDIEKKVAAYIGAGDETKEKFLGFERQDIHFKVKQTIVYGVLTLKVRTKGLMPFKPDYEKDWEVIKYVPTRDRPILWDVPGVSEQEQSNAEAPVSP